MAANIWAERFGSPAAPGPGVWQRDREHGRVMSDQISSYVGSDEHRATKILKDRFGSGDTRGWGRWTPEDHEPWPKTSVGGGGRGGKRVMVGKINWSQGTYPCPPEAPPLGISPSTTLEQLLPLLSAVAAERTLFSLHCVSGIEITADSDFPEDEILVQAPRKPPGACMICMEEDF